jgi:hypothetical protein
MAFFKKDMNNIRANETAAPRDKYFNSGLLCALLGKLISNYHRAKYKLELPLIDNSNS